MRTTIDNQQFPGTCSPAPGTGNTLPAATLASGRGPTFLMRKLRLRELGYLVRTADKGKGRSGCVLNVCYPAPRHLPPVQVQSWEETPAHKPGVPVSGRVCNPIPQLP